MPTCKRHWAGSAAGLYIITATRAMCSAMLASWITQASFEPLGFTVAVAKDRAIESLMQVGDTFVLNILEEGNHLPLMKHFLKRFPPGADQLCGRAHSSGKQQIANFGRFSGLSGVRSRQPDGS